jgi:hypothetical protein
MKVGGWVAVMTKTFCLSQNYERERTTILQIIIIVVRIFTVKKESKKNFKENL